MKNLLVLAFAAWIVSGCANQNQSVISNQTNQKPTASNPVGACATNFVSEGSFFAGTRFGTFAEFPNKSVPGAFDAVLQAVASSGYQIVSSNKEVGLISASQSVSYGHGKTAPMNFVIKKTMTPGVRVEISFSMSGGVSASTENVQREFCKLLASVAQSPNVDVTPAISASQNKASEDKKSPKKKVN
jgi:hypothetical protein